MQKIRKGDKVIVTAGKDKGKTGQVEKVLREDKVIVDGINMAKKAVKPNPQRGVTGGLIDKAMPIHRSNVGLLNPVTGKADRVGFKVVDGTKRRFYKSNGELVDV